MLQTVDAKLVYVVDLKTMPVLPIVGTGFEQKYAEALTLALRDGLITEPGKYGIEIVDWYTLEWKVYRIDE
jgi:hypothetical protein